MIILPLCCDSLTAYTCPDAYREFQVAPFMWPLYPHVTYVYVCVLSGAALTRIKLLFNRHVALVTVSGLLPWFHYYCAAYDECKYSDTFWLADRVHLFVHNTIALTSLCKLIWGHWNYKMPLRYIFFECVSKIKHIFSVIRYTIYGAVCFQFTHFPCDDWENIHFVLLSPSNRKYKLLSIV